MKRKLFLVGAIVLGILVLLVVLVGPGAPLLVRLGLEPVCIQGEWPHLKVVACPETAAPRPAVTPIPLPPLSEGARIPIIVDDDGSPDGVIALLFFLRHPQYDVRAVTVSAGEAHPERFAPHLVRLLAAMGASEVPVGVGRATPLAGENAFPDPWRQESDAFWGIELPEAESATEVTPAAELIVATVSQAEQPVSVFVGGPPTNLAEALRLDPGIRELIGDVYLMGGSVHAPGNIESDWPEIRNSVAEWNIWVDPVAAQEVFAAGWPLHLMPLDATGQVVWNAADADGWADSGTAEGALAADLLGWMLEAWSAEGVFIWDLAAAAATTDPRLCPQAALGLEVVVEPGPEQGRTAVVSEPANVGVCLEPDPAQVKARAASILGE